MEDYKVTKGYTIISDRYLRRITSELIDGLTIDGGHHKQYHLEQVLKLIIPSEFNEAKNDWQWEKGIPS